MKPINLKEKAINYRMDGYSYNMICEKLGLNKSTVANWTKAIPYKPNAEALQRVNSQIMKSSLLMHKRRLTEIDEMNKIAKKELGTITKRDLWMLGIGLYLGEGNKTHEYIKVSNANPEIIKIAVQWFKKICLLKTENFNPVLHIYPDNNINSTIKYWSETTGIPISQFGKTQIDTRTNKSKIKKNKLPYGTLHLYIKSHGNKNFGKRLHRRIMGWISASIGQIN